MPLLLSEKRRSAVITPNKKLTEFTKEALRPKSWYLPGPHVDVDPYTSVRKIFYEFPKKAFYGDTEDSQQEIKDLTEEKVSTIENTKKPINDKIEKLKEEDLGNSFNRLNINVSESSPVPSNRSVKTMDTNNNSNGQSISPKTKSNIIGYFSSKNSETSSLKEESTTYAEFYVPNAPKPTSTSFLRRGNKRRSFDSSKPSKRFDDDITSISSFTSSIHPLSNEYRSSLKNNETKIDPRPMIDRFLRDANKDICEGLYPAADDSISIKSDSSNVREILTKNTNLNFVPWTKRLSFIEAHLLFTEEQSFKNHCHYKRFSSLRRQKSVTLEGKKDRPTFRRAQTSLTSNDTLRSRIFQASLRRQNSDNFNSFKKRRGSSSSSVTLSKANDINTLSRDGTRGIKSQQTNRDSKRNSRTPTSCFFEGYQDKLREKMFSIQFPSTYDPATDPCREEYVPLFKEYDKQLIGKTYQQLFYIRSRLSENARKSTFQCDGCFGCSSEYECSTSM